jgi:hypothetical protein
MHSLKLVIEHVLRHRRAKRRAVLGGGTEMNPRVDARILHLLERLRESMERSRDAHEEIGLHLEVGMRSEFVREHADGSTADARMARWIVGMRGRREERRKRRIRRRCGVVVVRGLSQS